MKIVLVAPFGLQPKGTASVRALPLGTALAARGHTVTLLVPPWDDRGNSGKRFEREGVTVRHVDVPQKPVLDLPLITVRLWQEIRGLRPDLLHVFKPKAYSGFIALAWRLKQLAKQTTVPLLVDTDDWEGKGGWNEVAPYPRTAKWLFAWQEQIGLRHADGVTVASRSLETLVRSMGVAPNRLHFAPNGPGGAWVAPDPHTVTALRTRLALGDAPVALLFTRFLEFDTIDFAHRWAAIVQALPAARLLVVGQGLNGEEKPFYQTIHALGLSHTLCAVGWQPAAALPAYFALATVALYPMRDTLLNRAKCPVKLADYLQAGLAVVGEDVGMVREYLADGAGDIVPSGDSAAFVAATLALLRHPERATAIGARARQHLNHYFAWSLTAKKMEGFYHTFL